jgi:hypothetical protein
MNEERLHLIVELSCTGLSHWSLLSTRQGCINGRDVLIKVTIAILILDLCCLFSAYIMNV